MNEEVLLKLEKIIKKRRKNLDSNSYVVKLFAKGRIKIANKVGEEAVETISAYLAEGGKNLKEESADLIFHLLIMLEEANISIRDVLLVLKKRMKDD